METITHPEQVDDVIDRDNTSTKKTKPPVHKTKRGSVAQGDCRDLLGKVKNNSVALILTDPPYFIDGMGDDWDNENLQTKASKAGVIGGRPVGMKFERQQSYNFQEFLNSISEEFIRVLKPGGFLVCFSQARLYHRAACAFEDSGFEIRDMFAWHHNGQAKAFSQKHFVKRKTTLCEKEKEKIIKELGDRKTPQLKPQLEPMVFAQKPREGTFVENWIKWKTGLVDVNQSLDKNFPGNLMAVAKPLKAEKGDFNTHLTVKPIRLLEHLIRMLTIKNQIVLDPFLGSGSTAVAALKSTRKYIGFEKDYENFEISSKRIDNHLKQKSLF